MKKSTGYKIKLEEMMIALVTGASSGIGRDIARELAKRKYNIIIVARNKEALQELKEELEKEYEVKVYIKIVDLSNKENCINLYNEVKTEFKNIDILINNAGLGTCGRFTDISLEKEQQIIDTNITALHILMKLFLKDMCKINKGYIMNVASIAGFMPGPLMTTYYASKAYVIRLTQAVQKELKFQKSKVKVSALCPGPVKTNFQKVADVKFNSPEEESSTVARKAVAKMLKGRKVIFTSWYISLVRIFSKILPDSFMAFCCYFVQKRKI